MAELTQAFLTWLVCFGLAAFGVLVALHLVLRRLRASQRNSAEAGSPAPTGMPLSRRLLIAGAIGGFYVIILGPLAGSVVSYLNTTSSAQVSSPSETTGNSRSELVTAVTELDTHARPRLVPVPDPISNH